ncbi:hypothetical protein ABZ719_36095 [Streptomyces sp. NPDC006743]|uniref:hypothetical protein n=1 Tax=Streptomyces sp. NPDC006743 TaxID=3154480 RepID=UPI0034540A9A
MVHCLKAGVDVVGNVIAALCEERGALLSRTEKKECLDDLGPRRPGEGELIVPTQFQDGVEILGVKVGEVGGGRKAAAVVASGSSHVVDRTIDGPAVGQQAGFRA